jgi:hypothetical protein
MHIANFPNVAIVVLDQPITAARRYYRHAASRQPVWEDPPYGRQVDQYYAPFSGI